GIKIFADTGGEAAHNTISGSYAIGNGSWDGTKGGGIGIFNSFDNEITGCGIGVDYSTPPLFHVDVNGNAVDGLDIMSGSHDNRIGTGGTGNTIVDNGMHGINISGSGCTNNDVMSNNIGIDTTGTTTYGNNGWGILVDAGAGNTDIGSGSTADGNMIGDNGYSGSGCGGVKLDGSSGNRIEGNSIGVGDLLQDFGNSGNGIEINDGCNNNRVEANNVAYNSGNGVTVIDDSQGNEIRANATWGNGILGIDLNPNKDMPNDPVTYVYLTPDSPNLYMPFPTITEASTGPTTGEGVVSGTAIADSQVDVFYADNGPGQFGEGEIFIGSATADGAGDWSITGIAFLPGEQFVTATATATAPDSTINTSEFSENFLVSDEIPPTGSIAIDSGAAATNSLDVTLNMTCLDNVSASTDCEMLVSNYADFSGATWEPVPGTAFDKEWTLLAGDDGDRTVYVKFRDEALNESETYDATIALVTQPPAGSVVINGGAAYTRVSGVTLTITCTDAYYTPAQCEMLVSNNADFSGATWQAYSGTLSWNLLAGQGNKTVYIMFRDPLGNESGAYSDSIKVDATAPTGSVVINGGSTHTDVPDVKLTLAATDPYCPVSGIEMQVSNYSDFEGASWAPLVTSLDWNLLPGRGTKTVYVRFRDLAGNVSGGFSSSIQYLSTTWYLAEGSTAWGFSEYVSVQNPNDTQITVSVTYMTNSGPVAGGDIILPALSQTTINPADQLGQQDFSTKFECSEGKTFAVDRTMVWTGPGAASPEGHCSVGVESPAELWYLPEGTSGYGFETWLLIQNPNDSETNVEITYMIEGGTPKTVNRTIPAKTRRSYSMKEDIGEQNASIQVKADKPVIPERAIYRNDRREGTDSIGTVTAANDYYLAEGTTAWGFTTWILVQNPNAQAVDVDITYMTPDGLVAQPSFSIPANSRMTVKVNDIVENSDLSARVHGSRPIIAERSMYWDNGTGEAGHDSIGMPALHTTFYLPDGWSAGGHETWTLIQNPNGSDVEVQITYMTPDGTGNQTFKDVVKANTRKTYNMADKLVDSRAAIMVTTLTPGKKIIVERSMYWNNKGAGTDTIGGFTD
ncbi:MAG: right-handed parallel beta-helix repeat-containing protein, partial [Candidatus Geothermincolia bacterium]